MKILACGAVALAMLGSATATFAAQAVMQPPSGQARAATPLTVDSTIGELLANPAARNVLQRQVPIIVSSPQISQARALSLRSLKPYMATLLTDAKLAEIDAELARTPGAIASATSVRAAPATSTDPWAAYQLPTISLWTGRAPGQKGDRKQDVPTLTVVDNGGGTSFGSAVVVAPGGGYVGLASVYEGRAVRWVRAHAQDYGIDPGKIGMIGFSAGGHLTAMVSTRSDDGDPKAADPVDRVSSRPNFAILAYTPGNLGNWAGDGPGGVLGKSPSEAVRRANAPVLNVTDKTPPTFIFHTTTDAVVSSLEATAYYDALRKARVPAELHIFAEGRHGVGLGMTDPALSVWPLLLRTWLDRQGFLGSAAQPPAPVPPPYRGPQGAP